MWQEDPKGPREGKIEDIYKEFNFGRKQDERKAERKVVIFRDRKEDR